MAGLAAANGLTTLPAKPAKLLRSLAKQAETDACTSQTRMHIGAIDVASQRLLGVTRVSPRPLLDTSFLALL